MYFQYYKKLKLEWGKKRTKYSLNGDFAQVRTFGHSCVLKYHWSLIVENIQQSLWKLEIPPGTTFFLPSPGDDSSLDMREIFQFEKAQTND